MLTKELYDRAHLHAKRATDSYRSARAAGLVMGGMALPLFDSQDDHDHCRPEECGHDYKQYNEMTAEVLKTLHASGVPAETVVVRWSEFKKWLGSQPISMATRSAYYASLLSEARGQGKVSTADDLHFIKPDSHNA